MKVESEEYEIGSPPGISSRVARVIREAWQQRMKNPEEARKTTAEKLRDCSGESEKLWILRVFCFSQDWHGPRYEEEEVLLYGDLDDIEGLALFLFGNKKGMNAGIRGGGFTFPSGEAFTIGVVDRWEIIPASIVDADKIKGIICDRFFKYLKKRGKTDFLGFDSKKNLR